LFALSIATLFVASDVFAKGPFGTIKVDYWTGGAYASDATGVFSHCVAGAEPAVRASAKARARLIFLSPPRPTPAARVSTTFSNPADRWGRLFGISFRGPAARLLHFVPDGIQVPTILIIVCAAFGIAVFALLSLAMDAALHQL